MRLDKRLLMLVGALLLVAVALAACGGAAATTEVEVTRIVEVEVEVPGPEVEVTRVVEVEAAPIVPVIPFADEWINSPHNDTEGEAFNHWNEDDPAEVPTDCAKCHSTPGYVDFLGADGSAAGVVDAPAPIGTTVQCQACHNEVTLSKTSVVFPSGIEVTGLTDEARCMECHQGRASVNSVNKKIEDLGLTESLDTVSADLSFTNIHYYAAAATQFGTLAKGGYEYEGKSYDARFDHVAEANTCIECHDMHTLEINFEDCATCHEGVASTEDTRNIRMPGSLVDYDGDGDMEEGIYYEIEGLQAMLLTGIQAYANEYSGKAVGYNPAAHPYFFVDANGDGTVGDDETDRFDAWTGRLSKAAYNYQVSLKDHGSYVHGGKYIIELLYDSIEDLNTVLATPVDLSAAGRIDHGHFAGSEEAFRHWDGEEDGGIVPGSCARCHTATGLPQYLTEGVVISQTATNGMNCATCHNNLQEFTLYEAATATFPSGAKVSFEEPENNMCIQCHQGRESTVSVNRLIGETGPDEQAEGLRFLNVHYFAAGATLFGTETKGGYEYAGQEYTGRNVHVPGFDTCTECHDAHALEVVFEECGDCHEGVESPEDLRNIRVREADYDGDGDAAEGIAGEIETMTELLYTALVEASVANGAPIVYNAHRYPYWFGDADGNGEVNGEEGGYANWTPRLLRAAYNYQFISKDPGNFAHNSTYALQLLYDSLSDVGGDVTGMTRAVTPEE